MFQVFKPISGFGFEIKVGLDWRTVGSFDLVPLILFLYILTSETETNRGNQNGSEMHVLFRYVSNVCNAGTNAYNALSASFLLCC